MAISSNDLGIRAISDNNRGTVGSMPVMLSLNIVV